METNIFDKLVVIYKHFRYLSTEPLAIELLQKIFDEAGNIGVLVSPDDIEREGFERISFEEMYSKNFWLYLNNLQTIHDRMKKQFFNS